MRSKWLPQRQIAKINKYKTSAPRKNGALSLLTKTVAQSNDEKFSPNVLARFLFSKGGAVEGA